MSPDTARSSQTPGEGATAFPHGPRRDPWRGWLLAAALVAYPFLVYWVLTEHHPWLGMPITLAALLGLCACLPHRRTRMAAALTVLALAAAAVAFAEPSSLLFLPPLCVNLGLAWLFGRTLARGREALITRFARLEQTQLEPAVVSYTRCLTRVWVVFFLLMATVSASLAAFGAHAAWAWFTAVGNYLCVAALFAVEFAYRRRRFPRDDHVPPRQQIALLRAAMREHNRSG